MCTSTIARTAKEDVYPIHDGVGSGRLSFQEQGARFWNSLPTAIRFPRYSLDLNSPGAYI